MNLQLEGWMKALKKYFYVINKKIVKMTLLLSFMDIPLYKWGYDPISQILNQPSPTAREILGICFEILNIQQRKLWKISY